MNPNYQHVEINDRDFWFKAVEMRQQNWALIDGSPNGSVTVFFLHDRAGVFDRLGFASRAEAGVALVRNGFRRYLEDQPCPDHDAAAVPAVLRGEASQRSDLLVRSVLAMTRAGPAARST